jgi:hypothetical protein
VNLTAEPPKRTYEALAVLLRRQHHFLFSDLNNLQIADQISAFLAQKGPDS